VTSCNVFCLPFCFIYDIDSSLTLFQIPRHLLSPSPFTLDRLLAILRAIVPHAVPQNADIYTQIASLTALRLLTASNNADVLDAGACKWRVNFGWEYAAALGRSVEFEVADFMAGGGE